MEKEYIYYWYHHMMPDNERAKIASIFREKNYFEFIKYYKSLNMFGLEKGKYDEEFETFFPIIYFPNEISVYENGILVDTINILDRNNFNLITDNECECG